MVGLNTSLSGLPWKWKRFLIAGQPTAIVDANGRGMFRTVQAGVDFAAGGPGGKVWVRAGTYDEIVVLAQNQIHIEGESWDAFINGGTSGHAIRVTGARNTIRSLSVNTDAGQGNAYDAINMVTGGRNRVYDVRVVDSDQQGIYLGGNDDQCFGCDVNDSDLWSVTMAALRTTMNGCKVSQSMQVGSGGDNFRIAGNTIQANSAGAITINSGGDNGIADGNLIDGTISNSGTGNTIGDNEQF